MTARVLPPHMAIDLCLLEMRNQPEADRQVIDTQARVTGVCISKILPEGVEPLIGMQMAKRVGPSLVSEVDLGIPHLWLVNIVIGRHDVEVACEYDRDFQFEQPGGIVLQALEPAQLVVKFRTRRRIAVRFAWLLLPASNQPCGRPPPGRFRQRPETRIAPASPRLCWTTAIWLSAISAETSISPSRGASARSPFS